MRRLAAAIGRRLPPFGTARDRRARALTTQRRTTPAAGKRSSVRALAARARAAALRLLEAGLPCDASARDAHGARDGASHAPEAVDHGGRRSGLLDEMDHRETTSLHQIRMERRECLAQHMSAREGLQPRLVPLRLESRTGAAEVRRRLGRRATNGRGRSGGAPRNLADGESEGISIAEQARVRILRHRLAPKTGRFDGVVELLEIAFGLAHGRQPKCGVREAARELRSLTQSSGAVLKRAVEPEDARQEAAAQEPSVRHCGLVFALALAQSGARA